MKNLWLFLMLITLFACDKKGDEVQDNRVSSIAAPLETSLPYDKVAPAKSTLPPGAEKYRGKFVGAESSSLEMVIRDYPGMPGLLASNLYIGGKTDGALSFWYDEELDVLSSRKIKQQTNFSVFKLDATGDKLMEISYDWNKNTTDTALYIRSQTN